MRRVDDYKYWHPPVIWEDETVVLLGGGPSLNTYQVEICKSKKYKVIAINNSYALDATADIVYFCDFRWWKWHAHEDKFDKHTGIKVTLENRDLCHGTLIKSLRNDGLEKFNFNVGDCGVGNGGNSGYQALNLAVLMGCKNIILLGFDMRESARTHWHGGHALKSPPTVYNSLMIPQYDKLAPKLEAHGIKVYNGYKQSSLKCFEYIDI